MFVAIAKMGPTLPAAPGTIKSPGTPSWGQGHRVISDGTLFQRVPTEGYLIRTLLDGEIVPRLNFKLPGTSSFLFDVCGRLN
jgi:hypothetical protein